MALFFSGAVTSSPIKRRLRGNHSCQSLDVSLLSPDSSYLVSPSGDSSVCRRSARLLTNGYYDVTEDSFCWDDHGNVSLSPCNTNVSYKENLVRVFRRRRRPRNSLVRLLSEVTESCQSWLDEKVFRGVFGTALNNNNNSGNQEHEQDQEYELNQTNGHEPGGHYDPDTPLPDRGQLDLDSSCSWMMNSTEIDEGRSFTYDPTELPPPPDKQPEPRQLIFQEEICSETCQSKERFSQSLAGLSEVPPPSPFYTNSCCCPTPPEHTGFTMKALLLLILTIFILTALYSGCLLWGATVASTMFLMITTFMFLTKSGPMGEWRRAKTEDITSRNE